jgi:Cof subfamily protein (haloacid dehalogenase superfamily)
MVAPLFPIRLLALDIDGTLVGADLGLRDRTVHAIRAAVERGVSVSLVTGRMATSARDFAAVLGLTEPIVAAQGAVIREMSGTSARGVGRLLRHRPLAADVARETLLWSRDVRGMDPHINHLERLVIRADDPRAEDYSSFLGVRAVLARDLAEWIRAPVTKIIAVADEPGPVNALDDARRIFEGRAQPTVSHPRYLEFVAPGVTKSTGLHWLARRAGVPLSQVMAIGDQFGDLEMIADAGHGVAMWGAPDQVQSVARYIAPPLAEEGAAQMIERLILHPPRAGGRPTHGSG